MLVALLAACSCSNAARLVFDQQQQEGPAAAAAAVQLCPDSKSTCDSQSTCCSTGDGASACCPLENAVCCADGAHCCPAGTTCNNERASCDVIPSNVTRPAVRKQSLRDDVSTPASYGQSVAASVWMVCPDGSQCVYAGAACCRQGYSGRFSCCNYPLNVCCDDGVHCCHSGTVCDQLRLLCIPYPSAAPERQPWTQLTVSAPAPDVAVATAVQATSSEEVAVEKEDVKNVICPNGSQCPDGNTCCPTLGGGYGCCPFALATCCADRLHCCPFLTRCTSAGTCVRDGELNAPWSPIRVANP
jgi:hypothetical protein